MLRIPGRKRIARRKFETGEFKTRGNRASRECVTGCVRHVSGKITAGRYGRLPRTVWTEAPFFQAAVALNDRNDQFASAIEVPGLVAVDSMPRGKRIARQQEVDVG